MNENVCAHNINIYEASFTKGLNRLATIGYGHICSRKENLSFKIDT